MSLDKRVRCFSCQLPVIEVSKNIYSDIYQVIDELFHQSHLKKKICEYLYRQEGHTIHYRNYRTIVYFKSICVCSGCFSYGLYRSLKCEERLPYQPMHHDLFIQRYLYQQWCQNKEQLSEYSNNDDIEDNDSDNDDTITIIRADGLNYKHAIEEMSKYHLPNNYYCVYTRTKTPIMKGNQMCITEI